METKENGLLETPDKEVNLRIYQQECEVKGVCKSSLFTSSSLHKHKRKQLS